MPDSQLVPVVLSGGSGTRLWPVSREKHPKQLQPLLGGESLLQNTLRRLQGLPLGAPIVVSNQDYRFITAEQLRQLGLAAWTLLLEPAGRNTAPALTAAALHTRCATAPTRCCWRRRPTIMCAILPRSGLPCCGACPRRSAAPW
jgi:mannose-1-phosphate guanylyltransferase